MFKLLIPNKYNYVIRPLVRFKSIKSPKSPKPKPKPTAKLSPNVFSLGKFSQLHNDTSTTNIESKITSFDQLKIFPSVREAMIKEIKSQYNLKGPRHSNIDEIDIKPTPVQIAAIRKINQTRKLKVPNKDLEDMDDAERIQFELQNANEVQKTKVFTVAAETGSGKTWSYLAPLLSKLKLDDMEFWKSDPEGYDNTRKKGQFVKSVILLPTNELVDQVYETLQRANSFELEHKGAPGNFTLFLELPENKTMNITTMKLGQGEAPVRLFRQLETKGPVDVLITTPGKIVAFSKLVNINRPFRVFANVKYCVLDEADTLFDDSFEKNTTDVITHFPKLLDLILVSATILKYLRKIIEIIS